MDKKAMYNLSYGLFVLTARQGDKDNGCIINTLMQLTSSPMQIAVTVNKANLTHDMIKNTGKSTRGQPVCSNNHHPVRTCAIRSSDRCTKGFLYDTRYGV